MKKKKKSLFKPFFFPFTVIPWLNSLERRWKEGPEACSQAAHNRAWQQCYPDHARWWKPSFYQVPTSHLDSFPTRHSSSFWPHVSTPQWRKKSLLSPENQLGRALMHSLGPKACHQAIQACCSKGLTFRNSTGFTAPPQHSLCNIYWWQVIMPFMPAHESFELCSRSLRDTSELGTAKQVLHF